jgi:DNA-binding NarL/FixJ family response regulator
MIRLLIADDHAVVRKGLHQIFAGEADIRIIQEAASGAEVMNCLREDPFDVLILDINMPGKSGIDLIKDVKAESPKTQILILSMHGEDQFGVRALRSGASGYVTKDSDPRDMLLAVRRVASGKKYISPKLAELLELELHHEPGKLPHEALSDREFAVFCAIASGKQMKTIAKDLSLSVKTVSNYRARALLKMNMKTNAEIIKYGHHNQLVQ